MNPDYTDKIAGAISTGIERYFNGDKPGS
jgi:N-acetylmuramoyl-L-alanine amidase